MSPSPLSQVTNPEKIRLEIRDIEREIVSIRAKAAGLENALRGRIEKLSRLQAQAAIARPGPSFTAELCTA